MRNCLQLCIEFYPWIWYALGERRKHGIGSATGKFLWGTVKLGNRGQIVIPKEARDKYGLQEGSRLVVLGDEEGIALIQAEKFESQLKSALELSRKMVAED